MAAGSFVDWDGLWVGHRVSLVRRGCPRSRQGRCAGGGRCWESRRQWRSAAVPERTVEARDITRRSYGGRVLDGQAWEGFELGWRLILWRRFPFESQGFETHGRLHLGPGTPFFHEPGVVPSELGERASEFVLDENMLSSRLEESICGTVQFLRAEIVIRDAVHDLDGGDAQGGESTAFTIEHSVIAFSSIDELQDVTGPAFVLSIMSFRLMREPHVC